MKKTATAGATESRTDMEVDVLDTDPPSRRGRGAKRTTSGERRVVIVAPPQRRIVAAAIRFNGVIHSMPAPMRHHHVLQGMVRKVTAACKPSDQGFITSEGLFVSRETGMLIAREAGQLLRETDKRDLYSEDLW